MLVPRLLAAGYTVVVYDLMLFGSEGLTPHPELEVIRGDIRDTPGFARAVRGVDSVVHLACMSNDPSFELDPGLSKSINYDCFEPMVVAAKDAGVRRFIYASTSSVYGVSDDPDVTEEHPLVPLTDYNKYKGLCEPILFRHQSPEFTTVILRPATICGYSPRMRLDLSVNILTNHAVNKGVITVFGGEQKRPNLHIDDVVDVYLMLLQLPDELDRRRNLQRRVPESHDQRTGRDRSPRRRRRNAANGRRFGSRRRRATTCARITCRRARSKRSSGYVARADDRGCRARSVRGVQGGQAARQPR